MNHDTTEAQEHFVGRFFNGLLEHLEDIRGKIVDLKRLEGAMAEIVARCTGKPTPDCALFDTLFGAPTDTSKFRSASQGRRIVGGVTAPRS